MSAGTEGGQRYEVHLCPPVYPQQLHPFRCVHNPQFHMLAGAEIVDAPKGRRTELDSPICLACGSPLTGSYGGNVIGCIKSCLVSPVGLEPAIRARLLHLSHRYLAIAIQLFDADGWTGRHRKWATLIDPKLTMRVEVLHDVALVHVDEGYFRPQAEPWPLIAAG